MTLLAQFLKVPGDSIPMLVCPLATSITEEELFQSSATAMSVSTKQILRR